MQSAPLYEDIANAPAGGEAWWLTTSDKMRIRAATWPAASGTTPKGTVFLFPGRTEYVEKYGPAAGHFTAEGFAFLIVDWRGQGIAQHALPERLLGHVGHFSEYQTDIAAVVNLAEWLDLPKPWFLAAHSMGGCIGLRALHDGLEVAAAAFSAPMWGIQMAPSDKRLAWITSTIGTALGFGKKLTPKASLDHELLTDDSTDNRLTCDADMWDIAKGQIVAYPELALGGPTLSWLHAALVECRDLSRTPPPAIPSMVMLGTDEKIVDPEAIHHIAGQWKDLQFEMAEGGRHELMMEVPAIRNRFYEHATALFLRHAAL